MDVHPPELDGVCVAVQPAAADHPVVGDRHEQVVLSGVPRREAERGVNGIDLGAVTLGGLPELIIEYDWVHG
ncbi:hypothetical protein D3C72_2020560 [compost metagenome]